MKRPPIQLLKYLPAILFGLLIVTWMWEVFYSFAGYFRVPFGVGMVVVAGDNGTFVLSSSAKTGPPTLRLSRNEQEGLQFPGRLRVRFTSINKFAVYMPILVLLTLLFPLAVGPVVRFQFPLWSWFVLVAALAGELAIYATF
jgi:hypothetical protein